MANLEENNGRSPSGAHGRERKGECPVISEVIFRSFDGYMLKNDFHFMLHGVPKCSDGRLGYWNTPIPVWKLQ